MVVITPEMRLEWLFSAISVTIVFTYSRFEKAIFSIRRIFSDQTLLIISFNVADHALGHSS